jgi:hypothetical protein
MSKKSVLNLDTNWVDEFSGDPQTSKIFNKTDTLEEGVSKILHLSEESQNKLIRMLDEIKRIFGTSVIIYDPHVKSYESALRKAKNETGEPNQILRLNDGYRGSIISNNFSNITSILSEIDKLLPMYSFVKLSVLDTFANPWPNGYRDYNCRIKDTQNNDLVGELQIHFCPIKLFSQTVGHLSYEILRTLKEDDPCTEKVRDALQKVASAGYNSALELKDDCCFEKIRELQGKYNDKSKGGKKVTKKYTRRKYRTSKISKKRFN